MELLSNLENKKPKVIFDTNDIQILDIDGQNKIQQKSKLLILPYLIEDSNIVLKYKRIPTFNIHRPEIDRFVQILEGTVTDDTLEEILKNTLKKDFGIVINDNVKKEILSPIFLHQDTTSKLYICILPLMSYDYEQHIPETDKNDNILININELPNIVIYDIVTKYVLDLFKTYYSLF